jgi:hypothetical protein
MDDIQYKPNAEVVRSARAFIRALCSTYGHTQGMQVWDRVRDTLGDQAASDIFLGMLTGDFNNIRVVDIGPKFIEAIKAVRTLTGCGLKEAKDFVEHVRDRGPNEINIENLSDAAVEQFRLYMGSIGCVVE